MTIQSFLTPPSKSGDRADGCLAPTNDFRPFFYLLITSLLTAASSLLAKSQRRPSTSIMAGFEKQLIKLVSAALRLRATSRREEPWRGIEGTHYS
jgi:hypothetical protein